jgi:hypothetical protein
MRARVTNRSRAARGFQTPNGTVMVEAGATLALDLADHPLHRIWQKAGEVEILPEAAEAGERADAEPARARRPGRGRA